MNSSRFFTNVSCEYYPCHKSDEPLNCLFCYCPFYSWDLCPGENKYLEKPDGRRIKVCTDCIFPHRAENYDEIIQILKAGKDAYAAKKNPLPVIFYGVGVGPGKGDLLTKEAEEILRKADILLLPAKDRESCRAYNIALSAVPELAGKECLFLPFPMSMKEPALSQFHEDVANKAAELLTAGKSVAFLTIGDVSIYSTFVYVERLVKEKGFSTRYVSGISSFSAAASTLGLPLTIGSEELHLIPGSGDTDKALQLPGTKVFMKSGKHLAELKEKLLVLEKEKNIQVYAVSDCGLPTETVAIGAANISAEAGYLTVVIVREA